MLLLNIYLHCGYIWLTAEEKELLLSSNYDMKRVPFLTALDLIMFLSDFFVWMNKKSLKVWCEYNFLTRMLLAYRTLQHHGCKSTRQTSSYERVIKLRRRYVNASCALYNCMLIQLRPAAISCFITNVFRKQCFTYYCEQLSYSCFPFNLVK